MALSVGLLRLDVIKHRAPESCDSAVRTFLIPTSRDAAAATAATDMIITWDWSVVIGGGTSET